MRVAAVALVAVVGLTQAQPIRHDKWVANIQRMPPERVEACRSGCYVLTTKELADGMRNVANLATARARREKPMTPQHRRNLEDLLRYHTEEQSRAARLSADSSGMKRESADRKAGMHGRFRVTLQAMLDAPPPRTRRIIQR